MKTDTIDIDKKALCQLIDEKYGLIADTLTFVPYGEESYSYLLLTAAKKRYFVKVSVNPKQLADRYEAASKLYTHCGLSFVVHPYISRDGVCNAVFGNYDVGVFDFVDGSVSDQSGFDDEEWSHVARLVAEFHSSIRCSSLPLLPNEQFELGFEAWLEQVMAAVNMNMPLPDEIQYEARVLLASERNNITEAWSHLRQIAQRISMMHSEQVLTHGDLKPENFIKVGDGSLRLIDWNKIAIGPPERDLVNFVGARFVQFLRKYLGSFLGNVPRLNPDLFEFYILSGVLSGVADYGSWVLLEDAPISDKKHALLELGKLLPISRAQAQIEAVKQILESW